MNSKRLIAACALLFAAAGARAAPGALHLAVLEFEVSTDVKIDRTYFSDLARGAVHRGVPQIFVMTRESTEALLGANGKTMGDCIGECEVEVGRKLGADYIVSGRITQVGSRLSLTMRLFSTADGQLMESVEARGRSADELLDHVDAAMESLVAPLEKSIRANRAEAAAAADAGTPAPVAAKPVQIISTPATVEKTVVHTTPPPAPAPAPSSTAATSLPNPQSSTPPPSATPPSSATTTLSATPPPAAPAPLLAEAKPMPVVQTPPPAETKPTPVKITPPPASSAVASNALPPAPNEALEATPAPRGNHKFQGWLLIGTGAVIAGAAIGFDNLSSTSKDGKLTAVDFLPVAGYVIAAALGAFGTYQVTR